SADRCHRGPVAQRAGAQRAGRGSGDQLGLDAPVGPGQDHRRRPRAVARPRLHGLSRTPSDAISPPVRAGRSRRLAAGSECWTLRRRSAKISPFARSTGRSSVSMMRRSAAVAVASTAVATLMSAGSAAAAPKTYGTMAVSPSTGRTVAALGHSSRVVADAAAIRDCGVYDCDLVLHLVDNCGA